MWGHGAEEGGLSGKGVVVARVWFGALPGQPMWERNDGKLDFVVME